MVVEGGHSDQLEEAVGLESIAARTSSNQHLTQQEVLVAVRSHFDHNLAVGNHHSHSLVTVEVEELAVAMEQHRRQEGHSCCSCLDVVPAAAKAQRQHLARSLLGLVGRVAKVQLRLHPVLLVLVCPMDSLVRLRSQLDRNRLVRSRDSLLGRRWMGFQTTLA